MHLIFEMIFHLFAHSTTIIHTKAEQ